MRRSNIIVLSVNIETMYSMYIIIYTTWLLIKLLVTQYYNNFSLLAANKEALSIAHSSGANFIRVEGYVYSHIGDEGWIDSCAGQLLRHRKLIGADNVLIWSDIKKKHRQAVPYIVAILCFIAQILLHLMYQ